MSGVDQQSKVVMFYFLGNARHLFGFDLSVGAIGFNVATDFFCCGFGGRSIFIRLILSVLSLTLIVIIFSTIDDNSVFLDSFKSIKLFLKRFLKGRMKHPLSSDLVA